VSSVPRNAEEDAWSGLMGNGNFACVSVAAVLASVLSSQICATPGTSKANTTPACTASISATGFHIRVLKIITAGMVDVATFGHNRGRRHNTAD